MIRFPTRLKERFRKEGAWRGFFEKYKHRMRPAIVDNVLKMLSCGLTVRGYAVFQCSNPECSHQKKVCFICKSRFCPTCSKKLTDQWIEEQKAIIPDIQWQHITSSKVEDFIKRLVQHIPDKGSRMIRYYGFLATSVR